MSEPVTVGKFAVGQSVRRLEDPRLLRGFGRYSDDVGLPHQATPSSSLGPRSRAHPGRRKFKAPLTERLIAAGASGRGPSGVLGGPGVDGGDHTGALSGYVL